MSQRSPFTRNGRTLIILHPRKFVPQPLYTLFRRMLFSPSYGVSLVLRSRPAPAKLAVALAGVGLLKGVLDYLWLCAMTGLDGTGAAAAKFLLLSIAALLLLWLMTAFILHLGARLLGGRGSLRQGLQVTGVAMGFGLVTSLINGIHLLFPPGAVVRGSFPFTFGVGHLFAGVWLTLVCYQTGRQEHQLPPIAAFLAAPVPILLALIFFLL